MWCSLSAVCGMALHWHCLNRIADYLSLPQNSTVSALWDAAMHTLTIIHCNTDISMSDVGELFQCCMWLCCHQWLCWQ
jgi:hypothetical protein